VRSHLFPTRSHAPSATNAASRTRLAAHANLDIILLTKVFTIGYGNYLLSSIVFRHPRADTSFDRPLSRTLQGLTYHRGLNGGVGPIFWRCIQSGGTSPLHKSLSLQVLQWQVGRRTTRPDAPRPHTRMPFYRARRGNVRPSTRMGGSPKAIILNGHIAVLRPHLSIL